MTYIMTLGSDITLTLTHTQSSHMAEGLLFLLQ